MKMTVVHALGMLLILGGCTSAPAAVDVVPSSSHPVPGSDRDAGGCIPSAGYQWCPATGQCERSWELAKEKGFESTGEAFAKYCRIQSPKK